MDCGGGGGIGRGGGMVPSLNSILFQLVFTVCVHPSEVITYLSCKFHKQYL